MRVVKRNVRRQGGGKMGVSASVDNGATRKWIKEEGEEQEEENVGRRPYLRRFE